MRSKLDDLERVEVTGRAQWRAWLKKHHARTVGIWLVHWKKAHPDKHIGYEAIVQEALCFGWIDSLPRKLDEHRSMLYLSPRKPKSVWSAINKQHVERLIAAKRMAPAGLRAIATAKANGSWNALDAVETLKMPPDLGRALAADKTALAYFEAFPPSSRKAILQWIGSAKTPATRDKRVRATVALAAKNMRADRIRQPENTVAP